MKSLTQKEIIKTMGSKKVTANELAKLLTSNYPKLEIDIKTVRDRIDSLRHSPYVEIEIFREQGKLTCYRIKSVSPKFHRACAIQAKRYKNRRTDNGRIPLDRYELSACKLFMMFDVLLSSSRAA